MNNWISFGAQRPTLGTNIEIKFDDGTLFRGPYGKITRIVDIADLPSTACVVMRTDLKGKAWSMCSDDYVSSVVRDTYFWRAI